MNLNILEGFVEVKYGILPGLNQGGPSHGVNFYFERGQMHVQIHIGMGAPHKWSFYEDRNAIIDAMVRQQQLDSNAIWETQVMSIITK